MKNLKIILVVLISVSLFVSSCVSKKIAYTSDIQKEYQFPESKLKKVQFYTSGEIVLIQTKQDGDVTISDGKLVMINSKDVEKVIVPKNTKCVLEEVVSDNKLIFSFEFGDGKVLLFGNNGSGCYSLMSKDWKNGVATIHYANKNYITTDGDVFLTIKAKKLSNLKAKERVVHGRKI